MQPRGRDNSHSHRLRPMQPKRRQPAILVLFLGCPSPITMCVLAYCRDSAPCMPNKRTGVRSPAAVILGRAWLATKSFYGHILIYGGVFDAKEGLQVHSRQVHGEICASSREHNMQVSTKGIHSGIRSPVVYGLL